MTKNSSSTTTIPNTVWLARGCHPGPEPEQDVRRNLIALKAAGVLDDFLDLDPVEAARSTVLHPREESAAPARQPVDSSRPAGAWPTAPWCVHS